MASFEFVHGELRPTEEDVPYDDDTRETAGYEPTAALHWRIDDGAEYLAAYAPRADRQLPWLLDLSTEDTVWVVRVPGGLPDVLRFVKEYGLVWIAANVDVDVLVDRAAKIAANWEKRVAEASRRGRQMPDVRI